MTPKTLIAALCALFMLPVHAAVFNLFGPVTGPLVGSATTYQTRVALSADITALWIGAGCSGVVALQLNGSCGTIPNLLPLNNTWTGQNTFAFPGVSGQASVYVGNASNQGILLVGNSSVANANPTPSDAPHMLEVINDNGADQMVRLVSYGVAAFGPDLHFEKARGTQASPTALQTNDIGLSIGMRGYDGSNMSESTVAFEGEAAENWDGTHHGSWLDFELTPIAEASGARVSIFQLRALAGNVNNPTFVGPTTGNGSLIYMPIVDSAGTRFGYFGHANSGNASVDYESDGALNLIGNGGTNKLTIDTSGNLNWSGPVLDVTTGRSFVSAGDTAFIEASNTAGTAVMESGTVEAWEGGGTNVTDLAIGALANFNLYSGNSGTASITMSTVGAVGLPKIASSSSATTGTVCWTTATGNLTVDTTTGCLASSERFKTGIALLDTGWYKVLQLRPVSYTLKDDPMHDGPMIGLVAEQVAAVDPRLVAYDATGAPHGVRYWSISVLLLRAVKVQQYQILFLFLWNVVLTLALIRQRLSIKS
jgi:hypothetical protein